MLLRPSSKVLLILGLSLASTACGLGNSRKVADQVQVNAAVKSLQDGEVVRRMNEGRIRQQQGILPHSLHPRDVPRMSAPSQDPCPGVADVSATSTEAEFKEALKGLGSCLRGLSAEAQAVKISFNVFQTYDLALPIPFSQMSAREIFDVLRTTREPALLFGTSSPLISKLRNRYTDVDLQELLAIVTRRLQTFHGLADLIYAALDHHPGIAARASSIDRWAALLAMREHRQDLTGVALANSLKLLLGAGGRFQVPRVVRAYPAVLLNPYALMALVPGEGREDKALDPASENPFFQVLPLLTALGGTRVSVDTTIQTYRTQRDQDNPPIPAHAPAREDAVRVVFADSGMDFVQFPELGLFAGNGNDGQLAQGDYADLDANPWSPSLGALAHGSGTLGTMLTLIAQQAPQLLQERRVDVSMWKVFSLRSLLAGPPFNDVASTDPRNPTAFIDAIIAQTPPNTRLPQIVSVSLGGGSDDFISRSPDPRMLNRLPWLWVMAAGNEGQDLATQRMGCFEDVTVLRRPDARILCVGALIRTPGGRAPQIASYSNFGDRVDVYAYQTYDERCPNGTSCSTPAITAVAVQVQAKYPQATPLQIKRILLAASREQLLEVEPRSASAAAGGLERRTVRVLDPLTMMDRVFAEAEAVFGSPAPSPAPAPSPSATPQIEPSPEPSAAPSPATIPSPSPSETQAFIDRLLELGRRLIGS